MAISTPLEIDQSFRDDVAFVVARGVLDLVSYRRLRDCLLTCAMELPRAIVVDVTSLSVPTEATLAVFSSVWMRVSEWPGVPIMLVASQEVVLGRIQGSAIAGYLPVYGHVDEALEAIDEPPARRRSVVELPCSAASAAAARQFVSFTCAQWGCADQFIDAELIASELVENAVRHARSESRLRLELRRGMLTVAVYDDDRAPARMIEPTASGTPHLGLQLVGQLASTWNCAPTAAGGKVVWAVLRRTEPAPTGRSEWRTTFG